MGKRKKDRKKQLREIQERRVRYLPKYPRRPFSLGRFLQMHLPEIILGIGFIAAFLFIYSRANIIQNPAEIESLTSSVSPKQINSLKKKYPKGFRMFAITHNNILALNVNTLPAEMKIDWGASKILKMDRDEIRLNIGRVSYHSKTIAPTLTVKLPRRQGKASSVVTLNKMTISVDLLGEYQDGIFCVLGLQID